MPNGGIPSKDPVFKRFVLSLEGRGSDYRARAGHEVVDLPPWSEGSDDPVAASEGVSRDVRRLGAEGGDKLVQQGRRLFEWVFRGVVGEVFREAMLSSRNRGQGLTLCIQLDEAPELASKPWEALWDPRNEMFLMDCPNLVIARTLKKAAIKPPRAGEQPLKLLALIPEPDDAEKLSGMREWKEIQKKLLALEDRDLIVGELLEPATLDELGRKIAHSPFDVLHVAAHGEPGAADDMGLIHLEKADGRKAPVTGVDFAKAVTRRRAPRLVVLNACYGARSQLHRAYDGLAPHLLRRGVAAVVAMRTTVSDKAAVRFATALYGGLAKGHVLEQAMADARRELSVSEHRAEWSTPVLYLGADHVRLVEPPQLKTSRTGLAKAVAALAVAGLGAWAWWGWGSGERTTTQPQALLGDQSTMSPAEPDPCPPPVGLEELRFIRIKKDVVEIDGESVAVAPDFCISIHEVTRGIWKKVMDEELPRKQWVDEQWPMTDILPADVTRFAERLNGYPGHHIYRLPTRAEWELAARSGSESKYFFGDDEADLDQHGNCKNFLGSDGHDGPAPVGSFLPNSIGLYDVHGNVAEWVLDSLEIDELLAAENEGKLLKMGGSFDSKPINCAFGGSYVKGHPQQDVGFRIVREIASAAEPG